MPNCDHDPIHPLTAPPIVQLNKRPNYQYRHQSTHRQNPPKHEQNHILKAQTAETFHIAKFTNGAKAGTFSGPEVLIYEV